MIPNNDYLISLHNSSSVMILKIEFRMLIKYFIKYFILLIYQNVMLSKYKYYKINISFFSYV
jgi:hypothetical protein